MAFQIECKCGKKLTLNNSMKGKKFHCPHCKLVISLKTKTTNFPGLKPVITDDPLIALKDDSNEFQVSDLAVPVTQQKPTKSKKPAYDEVEQVCDEVEVIHEIDADPYHADPYEDDQFARSARHPAPHNNAAFSSSRQQVQREGTSPEKVIFIAVVVALGLAFAGIVIWQISVNLPNNDNTLAESSVDQSNPRDEFDNQINNWIEANRKAPGRIVPNTKKLNKEPPSNTLNELQKGFENVQRNIQRDRDRRRSYATDEINKRRNEFQRRYNANRNRGGTSLKNELARIDRDFREQQRKRKQEEARNEKEIREVFKHYQEAVALRVGEKVVSLLSKDTRVAFDDFRKHALYSEKKVIKKLPLTEQLMSLAIRVRYFTRKLEKMSLQDYCAQYFSEVPVDILDHGYRDVTLGKLFVFDDHASAHDNRSPSSKYVPIIYFKKETDGWKIDLFNKKNRTDSTLELKISSARLQSRSRLTKEGYIVRFAKLNATRTDINRRRIHSIWRPLK